MASYGSNHCWLCLCEVCTRMHCRKLNRRYSIDHCISMYLRERCPVRKCEDFQHRQKHKVFKVLRREKKKDQLNEKLDRLLELLERRD